LGRVLPIAAPLTASGSRIFSESCKILYGTGLWAAVLIREALKECSMTSADGNTVISYLRRTLCAGTLAGAPDEELLEQFVAQRDEAAFAALLRRHGPMVWGVCQRLLAHRQDAEDAFQATFLILARKAAAVGRRQLLANWLFGVARRAALNLRALRARRARHEQSYGDLPDVQATVEKPWDDIHAVLDEELARLPAKYRLPLLLCGLEGMTHAEAGKYLGWPTGTVAGRLSRGRERLRTRLLRRGVTAPTAVLAAIFAPDAVSAAVPPQLVADSIRGAAALVTAGPSAAAVISPAVVMLMRGVLLKMFLSRLLTTTAVLAALVLTLGSAGAVRHRTPSAVTPLSAPAGPAEKRLHAAPAAHAVWPVPGQKLGGTATPAKPAIRLPTDANAVVARMDRSVDAATGPEMAVTVYADGRVVAEVPDGLWSLSGAALTRYAKDRVIEEDPDEEPERPPRKTLEGRLSAQELAELLRFAIHEQDFFDFDPVAVKAAIRDKYQFDANIPDATDATTTGFRIQTADRNHEVRWSRLGRAAWEFPEVEPLLQLYALDTRLSQVFYILLAGGPEQVAAAAEKMNELVLPYYHLYPNVPRLTAADLLAVTPSADGSRMRFAFSRNKDKQVRNPLFEAAIDVPQQGEPTLVYVIPPQRGVRVRTLTPTNGGGPPR
jgi:RNA polymerase sigma factor (sigma-70 family)